MISYGFIYRWVDPPDVDYARYVEEAIKLAADLGVPGFRETILS